MVLLYNKLLEFKNKNHLFMLLTLGLGNLVCRFNPYASFMCRENAQCPLTSTPPMTANKIQKIKLYYIFKLNKLSSL